MITVDECLKEISVRPGCAVGIPLPDLHRIWDSICTHVFRTVIQRKTLIIPNLCHFYFSSATMDQSPQFFFSPNFCTTYGVTTLQPAMSRVTHNSTRCPNLTLNPSVVAVHSGVTREAVMNVLKDLIRKFGEVVLHGKGGHAICIEFTDLCKVIVRHGGRYDVHWNMKALGHMTNTTTRGLNLLRGREPSSNNNNNNNKTAVSMDDIQLDGRSADKVAAEIAVLVDGPSNAKTMGNNTNNIRLRPSSAPAAKLHRPIRDEGPPPQTQQQTSQQNEHVNVEEANTTIGSDLGGNVQIGDSVDHQHPMELEKPPAGVSDSNHQGLHTSTLVPFQRPEVTKRQAPSKYLLHKAHKAQVRRGRQETYVDSWENQLSRKREQREKDFALAVQAQNDYIRKLREEEERDNQLKQESFQQEVKVRDINLSLTRDRESNLMPRAHAMGSIFAGRQCNHSVPPDLRFLSKQIKEQEHRRKMEKEEDKRCGEILIQHDKSQMEAERRRRQEMKDALRRDLMGSSQSSHSTLPNSKDWGGDLFFANLSPTQRKQEDKSYKYTSRDEARKLQEHNLSVVRSREEEEHARRQHQLQDLRRSAKEAVLKEGIQRAHRQRVQRAMQKDLCGAWESQVMEKTRRQRGEAEQMKTWRDVSYWTNESSDDEN